MATTVSSAVSGSSEDGWDFQCPKTDGSCGDAEASFRSTGWRTRDLAEKRGQQHLDEHDGGDAMPSLDIFRIENGLQDADQPEA